MTKKSLLLLLLAGLVACGGAPKSFSTYPHSASSTPRLHAAVIDDTLRVRPSTDSQIFGVPYGSARQSAGLIGAAIDQVETAKSREIIYPLLESLSNFNFEDHFEKTLNDKVLSAGYIPASEVRYEMAPDRFSKMRSGTVVINAYQQVSMLMSTLWVGVTAHHLDDSSGSLEVRRSVYLYEFRLPEGQETFPDRELNADEWNRNVALVEYLLKTGMETAMEMLVSDLKGEIVVQDATQVKVGYQHLLNLSPNMYLVSENDDRIVVTDSSKTLIASISKSALRDGNTEPKSLVQIKKEAGILDTTREENEITAAAAGTNSATDDQGIFAFMGQAEDEILNKTYNKNLWAKALVDAEGDEQKRKSIYISLRAQQLYVESGGALEAEETNTALAVAGETAAIDLSGMYKTNLTGNTFYFTRAKQNPRVVLRQKGDQLEGDIEPGIGSLTGEIKDNQVKLEWITVWGEGEATLEISRGAKQLNGSWLAQTGSSGTWRMQRRSRQLTRLAPAGEVSTTANVKTDDQSEPVNDLSGTYRSELSKNLYNHFKRTVIEIELVQNGNKITGSFVGAKGYIDGVIVGNTIKYEARPPYGNWTIGGKWVFSDEFDKAAGDAGYHVTKGFWNLKRIE